MAKFRENIEKLATLLVRMQYAEESTLQGMESMADRHSIEYYKMLDALTAYKALLTPDELSRVNALCGPATR